MASSYKKTRRRNRNGIIVNVYIDRRSTLTKEAKELLKTTYRDVSKKVEKYFIKLDEYFFEVIAYLYKH